MNSMCTMHRNIVLVENTFVRTKSEFFCEYLIFGLSAPKVRTLPIFASFLCFWLLISCVIEHISLVFETLVPLKKKHSISSQYFYHRSLYFRLVKVLVKR